MILNRIQHLPVLSADFEPQRSMDRYLDSLFDPVLSDGIEVCHIITHSSTHEQMGSFWVCAFSVLARAVVK